MNGELEKAEKDLKYAEKLNPENDMVFLNGLLKKIQKMRLEIILRYEQLDEIIELLGKEADGENFKQILEFLLKYDSSHKFSYGILYGFILKKIILLRKSIPNL